MNTEKPTTITADLTEQLEAHRARLQARRDALTADVARLMQERRNVDAELAALPVLRARRKRQPKP